MRPVADELGLVSPGTDRHQRRIQRRPASRGVPDPAPELFGAAVADVGVFDILRFHHSTSGWTWKTEYGYPDDPAADRSP
jgi:hypothetical protein